MSKFGVRRLYGAAPGCVGGHCRLGQQRQNRQAFGRSVVVESVGFNVASAHDRAVVEPNRSGWRALANKVRLNVYNACDTEIV